MLDGCEINFRYWVFIAAATSLGYELEIVDTVTGVANTWTNPDRHPAETVATTAGFATCDGTPF